ncbi:MAG: carbohydrate binding family 9 domain-containing protein [Acidimicrobiia bacterium]|nr:carbohydrate binding family 9 domain-containing protein [Acidimicrobiia bacterium]
MTAVTKSARAAALVVYGAVAATPDLALAGQAAVPTLTVGRAAAGAPPRVDGRVDDEAWAAAGPYTAFVQQEPNEGEAATERTEIRFLIDQRNLYVAVVCFDSDPGNILVSQSRRDADLDDTDSIRVLLDTFNDGQNAFVFGTNPFGIEYDGQVRAEGQTAQGGGGGGGGFNVNWDGDWTVRTQRTERGWEAEFAIPLKTLRYDPGDDRTWGVNAVRNIRRKNEQVFLSPVPRGYGLQRVSVAAKLQGLTLPTRRDVKLVPYVAGAVDDDRLRRADPVRRSGDIGIDVKWGVRADLTLDLTVNTDFAQVEADVQQVNLTRFPLFFQEKRPFFLENAQLFQLGQPQSVDLFFSRRIGLSPAGEPIDILGGGRLSGRLGGYNVALLTMQTESAADGRTGLTAAPANNFTVVRLQREIGRSNVGAMYVGRQGVGSRAPANDYNRAYGFDLGWQATTNGRVAAFLARTDSPAPRGGSDYAGRAVYTYANNLWGGSGGLTQVGERFNPEVGFLRRRGFRSLEGRYNLSYQPRQWPWIRRIQPHTNFTAFLNLRNELESSQGHFHFFDIMTRTGARFGYLFETGQDRPRRPFTVYQDVTGRRVAIPAGDYAWTRGVFEGHTNLSAPVSASLLHRAGSYYDGDYHGWQLTLGLRAGARLLSELGWNRDDITLPGGRFRNDLVPLKVSYAFTSLASVQGLIQYNRQASALSSNIRLALLDRSGTGFFLVYNDRRDTSPFTTDELIGRSFVVKYTRLLDY